MKKKNDPFEGIFNNLTTDTLPTDDQKVKMLNYVLAESRLRDNSAFARLFRFISVYPWRFAFGAATVQAALFTLIFGTNYTNLFLRVFGG